MDQFNLDDVLGGMDGLVRQPLLQRTKTPGPNSQMREIQIERARSMKFEKHSFLDEAIDLSYGEKKADESEFTKKFDIPQSYRNLGKSVAEYCPSMTLPPFLEFKRYLSHNKGIRLKRDDHMLALFVHHTSKVHKRRYITHDVLRSLVGYWNEVGSKMNPRKLKVAGIRATIKTLQMRDPKFSLAAQFRSRKECIAGEVRVVLARQDFMLSDEGLSVKRTTGDGRAVIEAVTEEAERILAAVPAHSSICNSTIARWAVWRICESENLGTMQTYDVPVNHPTHRAWLAPLGCVVKKTVL